VSRPYPQWAGCSRLESRNSAPFLQTGQTP
jgi:hypothetical protein